MPDQVKQMRYFRIHARYRVWAAVLALGLAVATDAFGYSYGPQNRAEWDGWPEYCKARYTVSLIGGKSEFGQEIGRDTVARWQDQMGLCWRYLHHHCGAILQLNRAKTARIASDREFALNSAIKEDQLAARYCPASHPFSADIATHIAMSYVEAGDFVKATQSLDWVIQTHPAFPQSYLMKSSLLRRAGKAGAALEVLEAGDLATNGQSAEIHNAIGFAYLNAKDYEKARQHARKAYELGFPLPGLRDKLADAGYPL
jgi:tetratricopeptide (TPR) repeat protein